MNESERKELVQKALQAKVKLEKKLEKANKRLKKQRKHMEKLTSAGNQLFVEEEALRGTQSVFFDLLPERTFDEGSAPQIHF